MMVSFFFGRAIKTLTPTGLCLILILTFAAPVAAGTDKYRRMINCDISNASCTQSLKDVNVTLAVAPQPVKAMEDLQFRITLTGAAAATDEAPYIDLGMPGMDMGPNHVVLKAVGKNSYAGSGIIVRCPSGRTIWQATVTVPGQGTVRFIFDVVY